MEATLHEVIQRSVKVSKPNKKTAHDLFKSLIEQGEATADDLAKLYKFFLPPVPAKAKKPIDWVRKFVAKKDVREGLNYIYSDGNRNIATNGHFLAISHEDPLPEGYYDSKSLDKIEISYRYPQIDRVIPQGNPLSIRDIEPSEVIERHGNHSYLYHLSDGTEFALNKQYVDTVLANPSPVSDILFFNNSSGVLYQFDNGDQALIMPIRL